MQNVLLVILILCYEDVWIPILNTGIEYPDMARLAIIMQKVIKTHVNHHVGPVLDHSCSRDGIFVHLRHAIEYNLLLGWVTLQTWPLTTLYMLVVLPIYFRRSDANNFWCRLTTNRFQDLGEWLCIQIVPQIWFSIFYGITFSYVWCLDWSCPGIELLMLNTKLVDSLTQFLFWLVTVQFTDHSNHFHVIFRGVVLLHVYKTKLDSFKNDKL